MAITDRQREERRKFLGSSDVAAIMGLSTFLSPLDVYLSKVEGTDLPARPWQAWGNIVEPALLTWYQETRAVRLVTSLDTLRSKRLPMLGAHLDGALMRDEAPGLVRHAVEAKAINRFSPSYRLWGRPGTDEVPIEYFIQVHVQMMVCEIRTADVAATIAGAPPEVYPITFDDVIAGEIETASARFWREHVEKRRPPAPVNLRDVERLYPASIGRAIEATPAILLLVERAKELRDTIAAAEAEFDDIKFRVKEYMGIHDALTFNGRALVTWRSSSKPKQYFDEDAFAARLPELYRQFVKTATGSRRFSVK